MLQVTPNVWEDRWFSLDQSRSELWVSRSTGTVGAVTKVQLLFLEVTLPKSARKGRPFTLRLNLNFSKSKAYTPPE